MRRGGALIGVLGGLLASFEIDITGLIQATIFTFVIISWVLLLAGKESFNSRFFQGLLLVVILPVISCGIFKQIPWSIVILVAVTLSVVYVAIDLHRKPKPSKDIRIFEREPIYHSEGEELE